RFIPLNFRRNAAHQVWSLAVLLALAFCCRQATLALGLGGLESLTRFLVSGVVYTACVALLCLGLPAVMGFTRQELREIFIRFRKSRRHDAGEH
ncbi:MAG: lipopolysaccharide biosynthesis protein, partial [Desulfovibrio sp.]|nr:lipopolysaccharide biosynthesis protein [Desulfovibrio sp.]